MSAQLNQDNPQHSTRFGGPRRRRHRRIGFFALTLIIVGALFAAVALAHGGRRGWGGYGEGHDLDLDTEQVIDRLEFVFDRFDATEDQRQAITAIVEWTLPELVAFHGEAEVLKDGFRAMLESEAMDPAEVERLRTELVDLVDRASLTGVQAIVDTWNVLTPDQRSRIMELHR